MGCRFPRFCAVGCRFPRSCAVGCRFRGWVRTRRQAASLRAFPAAEQGSLHHQGRRGRRSGTNQTEAGRWFFEKKKQSRCAWGEMGNVFLFIGALPQLCFPLLHGRASLEGIYGTFLLYPVNSLCHSPCNGAWVVVMFLQEEGVHKLLPQLTVWKSLRESPHHVGIRALERVFRAYSTFLVLGSPGRHPLNMYPSLLPLPE